MAADSIRGWPILLPLFAIFTICNLCSACLAALGFVVLAFAIFAQP
jgi:hypothetical protein